MKIALALVDQKWILAIQISVSMWVESNQKVMVRDGKAECWGDGVTVKEKTISAETPARLAILPECSPQYSNTLALLYSHSQALQL